MLVVLPHPFEPWLSQPEEPLAGMQPNKAIFKPDRADCYGCVDWYLFGTELDTDPEAEPALAQPADH